MQLIPKAVRGNSLAHVWDDSTQILYHTKYCIISSFKSPSSLSILFNVEKYHRSRDTATISHCILLSSQTRIIYLVIEPTEPALFSRPYEFTQDWHKQRVSCMFSSWTEGGKAADTNMSVLTSHSRIPKAHSSVGVDWLAEKNKRYNSRHELIIWSW